MGEEDWRMWWAGEVAERGGWGRRKRRSRERRGRTRGREEKGGVKEEYVGTRNEGRDRAGWRNRKEVSRVEKEAVKTKLRNEKGKTKKKRKEGEVESCRCN
jgi:hypothetical protein